MLDGSVGPASTAPISIFPLKGAGRPGKSWSRSFTHDVRYNDGAAHPAGAHGRALFETMAVAQIVGGSTGWTGTPSFAFNLLATQKV